MGYMSPEQVRGLPVDHRTDLFSFGAILYELLSGRKAFKRDTASDTIAAILKDEPPELIHSGRNISPALDHIVRHCLEKDRENRFQSAKDVAFALSEASAPTTAHERGARRPAARAEAWEGDRGSRRRPSLLLAAAGLFLWKRPKIGGSTSATGVRRVAVLPFENLGAAEDDYFADGIADAIRGKLASVPGLEVIARGSSTPYKKTTKTPQQIAKELNARYLLTATVRWQKVGQRQPRPGQPRARRDQGERGARDEVAAALRRVADGRLPGAVRHRREGRGLARRGARRASRRRRSPTRPRRTSPHTTPTSRARRPRSRWPGPTRRRFARASATTSRPWPSTRSSPRPGRASRPARPCSSPTAFPIPPWPPERWRPREVDRARARQAGRRDGARHCTTASSTGTTREPSRSTRRPRSSPPELPIPCARSAAPRCRSGRWQDVDRALRRGRAPRSQERRSTSGTRPSRWLYLRRCDEARQAIDRTLALAPDNLNRISQKLQILLC